ncbi:hypothetical protein Hte_001782 [Hypoxylon texense]
MAATYQSSAAGLPDPVYVFSVLSGLGFFTQWVVMLMNGSFVAMLLTTWDGSFPDGAPLKTWTGIWPIDFVLGLLVVFFGGVLDVANLSDLAPFLILTDLIFALAVCGFVTLVEDRRNRQTGPLRYPAFWQIMWNYCGAGSVLPVYSRLYVKSRLANKPGISYEQAQALPFTALWAVALSLPLLAPAVLGATPFQIQGGIVVWFFSPLAVGPFQDLVSALISRLGFPKGIRCPVTVAYCISGLASAAAHLGVVSWAFFSPDLSWSRIYWPNHGRVQQGPDLLTEAAVIFMQYGHIVVQFCVLTLGIYILGFKRLRIGHPVLMLVVVMAIAGPGAGLAWLLCQSEKQMATTDAKSKRP